MINSTYSYNKLKQEQQGLFDFFILVTHSIPTLSGSIKYIQNIDPNRTLPKPDHFKKGEVHIDRLSELINKEVDSNKSNTKSYKTNLCKYVLLSSFSFFETYFKSVMEELIIFLGSNLSLEFIQPSNYKKILEKSVKNILEKQYRFNLSNITKPSKNIKNERNEILGPFQNHKKEQYKHYTNILKTSNYRFPSELLSFYGLNKLMQELQNLKSYSIPYIMKDVLYIDISQKINKNVNLLNQDIKTTFDMIRELRNDIAHGNKINPEKLNFKIVLAYNYFLKKIALQIDKQLTKNFFIIEEYLNE